MSDKEELKTGQKGTGGNISNKGVTHEQPIGIGKRLGMNRTEKINKKSAYFNK